jgi:N-acetyl-anhydromuramyl-L-alanine amidase AmpD
MKINEKGHLIHANVKLDAANVRIERGPMQQVRGIVVHQTGSQSAGATLNSYRSPGANGAHFLIDRDGTIYQTASVHQMTWHVGPLKARCLAELRCTPVELKALKKFDPKGEHQREIAKAVPDRYPSNQDAIGIELVGQALPNDPRTPPEKRIYETVTPAQNASLKWLVTALTVSLGVPMSEVFRHPAVSRKNPSEAATAVWQ